MVNTNTFTLTNYFDVWGNAKDGWEVNNQCIEADDLVIADDASPKEICQGLKRINMLATSDMRRLEVVDWGDMIEVNEKMVIVSQDKVKQMKS